MIRIQWFSGNSGLKSPGFTLIETIAVLILLGIVSVVAISRFVDLEADIRAEEDKFRTFIRHAQAQAMNSSNVWGVSFSSGSYFLFRDGDISNDVTMPGESSSTISLPSGITISQAGIVAFDSWGRPYTDQDAATLQNGQRTINLSKGGTTRSIIITQNTGFIP